MSTLSELCFEDQVIECTANDEIEYSENPADWADYEDFCREVDERHEMERVERLEDEYRMRYGA
jgi:hypothetical protein